MSKRTLHREQTVLATAGPVGASYAVAEKNWKCTSCRAENFARRSKCFRCKARKPKSGGGTVWHEGAVSAATGVDHNWREAMDPNTRQVYYYNTVTKATTWDRPAEMGEAPLATGWFGRGAAGQTSRLEEMNKEYLKRPAPKQSEVSANANNTAYQEGSNDYNIWYGRHNNNRFSNKEREAATARCKVNLHAGYTLADAKGSKTSYFCIWWAKGMCNKGSKCQYFHRIPTIADCGRLEKDMLHDAFGRDRHASHREDMGGAGSFNDSCRTLFVGGLKREPYEDNPSELKKIVKKHFSEWGDVEHINIVWRLAVAFVRFRMRSHAEIAKIAMAGQELEKAEIVNIRWAYDDPNPIAQEANRRANADAVVAAIKQSGHHMTDPGFEHPADYKMPMPADQKQVGDNFYPNTNSQYAGPHQIADAATAPEQPQAKKVKTAE